MVVPNFVPFHRVDVKIFHRISNNFELLMVLQEGSGITRVSRIRPLRNLIVVNLLAELQSGPK